MFCTVNRPRASSIALCVFLSLPTNPPPEKFPSDVAYICSTPPFFFKKLFLSFAPLFKLECQRALALSFALSTSLFFFFFSSFLSIALAHPRAHENKKKKKSQTPPSTSCILEEECYLKKNAFPPDLRLHPIKSASPHSSLLFIFFFPHPVYHSNIFPSLSLA